MKYCNVFINMSVFQVHRSTHKHVFLPDNKYHRSWKLHYLIGSMIKTSHSLICENHIWPKCSHREPCFLKCRLDNKSMQTGPIRATAISIHSTYIRIEKRNGTYSRSIFLNNSPGIEHSIEFCYFLCTKWPLAFLPFHDFCRHYREISSIPYRQ